MKIRSLKLKDRNFGEQWSKEVEHRWNYDDFLRRKEWKEDWISFDGVVYHRPTQRVYCGITSFAGDIFKAYDIARGEFVDLGFQHVGDKYDAKFHRSMELTRDGKSLFVATALLHDIDRYFDAPGGSIYRHDIASGKTQKLCTPIPHCYIQSIALDERRGLIYSMHFTPEYLSRYDVNSGKTKILGLIGSGITFGQGENLVIDDDGCVWSGWTATRAWQSSPGPDACRLCKYDPHEDRMHFFSRGLPRADGEYGNSRVEGLFDLGTGCLYASAGNGSLYRLNPRTGECVLLGTPIADRRSRLTSLLRHKDGFAYGITGRDGECRLLRFDIHREKYELGDAIIDSSGVAMYQCHDITITPEGVLYAGENDHPQRSSYLWEITL
ncbi:MAG TPA: hypothetical protein VEJ63_04430 [Planctomycetota bacterium]|nr:hypothetical protein [Planctomycetota bacterium]